MVKSLLQKFLILVLVVAAGYLAVQVGKVAYERYALQLQINKVKAQIERLGQANKDLEKLLAQLGSEEFLTLKLKEELNLKGQEEQVAIVKNSPFASENDGEEEEKNNMGYWRKWLELFLPK